MSDIKNKLMGKRKLRLQCFEDLSMNELNPFFEKIGKDPKTVYTMIWLLGGFAHTSIRHGWTKEEISAVIKEATSGDEQKFYRVLLDYII